ncbi:MAG: hypothetical protein CSB34_06080 [Desulfobulbus propionicus]|nr:MAG: hypothetical protein CSB34_06080 [Desulfobulbus propionicus]
MTTGPFCGSRLWGASRFGVYTKSPFTGFSLESYSGGKVAEAMNAAGFDAIIFIGKADKPAVPVVQLGGVEFIDGSEQVCLYFRCIPKKTGCNSLYCR